MGRKRGSYKFEKRQKELKKQKKKREKLEKRLNKGGDFDDEPQPTGWEGGPFKQGDSAGSEDDPVADDAKAQDDS